MAEIVEDTSQEIDYTDTSVVSPTPSVSSVIVDEIQQVSRDFSSNKDLAIQSAFVMAGAKGTNPVEEYQEKLDLLANGANMDEVLEADKAAYAGQIEADMTEALLSGGVPATLSDGTPYNYSDDAKAAVDLYLESDGLERIRAEIYGLDGAEPIAARYDMAKQEALRITTEQFGEQGWFDALTNFSAALIPGKWSLDVAQFTGGIWGSLDEFAAASYEYQGLDPETQRIVFRDVILPRIMDAADENPSVALSIVEMLHNPRVTSELIFNSVLDAAAVGEIADIGIKSGRAGIAAFKSFKQSRNIAKKYKDIDNDKAAATGVGIAGMDDAVDIGMTKLDAAHSANPHKTTVVSANAMEDVSEAVQKARKTTLTRLSDEIAEQAKGGDSVTLRKSMIKSIRRLRDEQDAVIGAFEAASTMAARAGRGKLPRVIIQALKGSEVRLNQLDIEIKDKVDILEGSLARKNARVNSQRIAEGNVPTHLQRKFDEMVEVAVHREIGKMSGEIAEQSSILGKTAEVVGGSKAAGAQLLEEMTKGGKVLDNPEQYGLSEEYALALEAQLDKVRATAARVEELAPDALTPLQKGKITTRMIEKLQKSAKQEGGELSVGEPVLSKEGFSVTYVRDGVEDTVDYTWSIDDVGLMSSLENPLPGVLSKFKTFLSPEIVVNRLVKSNLTQDVKFAQDQSAKLANALLKEYKGITKGMNKEDQFLLDEILMSGDKNKEVYSFGDLLNGTTGIGGTKPIKRSVVDAYFRSRAFYDELHSMRNAITRKQLDFMGMRNVRYVDESGTSVNLLGKPVSVNQVNLNPGEMVFNANARGTKTSNFLVGQTARDFANNQDYQFVRLLEPKKRGKLETRFAIFRDDDLQGVAVGGLPQRVLNYTPGYTPRVYSPGYWFVKSNVDNTTLMAAETREQAQKWAKQATDESDGISYTAKSDREFDPLEAVVEGSKSFGGLYTGSRKSLPLQLKREDGVFTDLEQVSRSQATAGYIQSISNVMPMNEYRMGTVKEWENTVKELLKAEGKDAQAAAITFNSITTGLTNTRLAKDMEHGRDYIRRVMSVPSEEETKTANLLTRLADRMYGTRLGGKPRDWVKSGIHADPVRTLKGLTFNLHLGAFNVRQLFVQGQNAVLAMSVSPQHAPAAFLETMAMRAAFFSDDPKVWRKMAELNPTLDADDFVDNMQAFKDSGLVDGIVRQADHDAAVVGMGQSSMQGYRKLAAAGQVFFTEGETIARMTAWNIAKRRLPKGATPQELSHETTRLSMNMSSANSATWQNNLLGVPTQFLQVQAKFLENTISGLMGKGVGVGGTGWTRKEAASILAGQVVLYGAVGVPIAEDAVSFMAQITGTTPQAFADENPLFLEAVDEGAVGVLTKVMGFENNFSKSGSLLTSTTKIHEEGLLFDSFMALSSMFVDRTTDVDMASLMGVQSSTFSKTGNVLSTMYRNMRIMMNTPSLDNLGAAAIESADALLSMTSTWSNAKKGLLIHNIGLRSRRTGGAIFGEEELSELSIASVAAKALGFELDIETQLWEKSKFVWDFKKESKALKQDWAQAHSRYLVHGNLERLQSERAYLLALINNPAEEAKFVQEIADGMKNPKSQNDRVMRSFGETVFNTNWVVLPRAAIIEE